MIATTRFRPRIIHRIRAISRRRGLGSGLTPADLGVDSSNFGQILSAPVGRTEGAVTRHDTVRRLIDGTTGRTAPHPAAGEDARETLAVDHPGRGGRGRDRRHRLVARPQRGRGAEVPHRGDRARPHRVAGVGDRNGAARRAGRGGQPGLGHRPAPRRRLQRSRPQAARCCVSSSRPRSAPAPCRPRPPSRAPRPRSRMRSARSRVRRI